MEFPSGRFRLQCCTSPFLHTTGAPIDGTIHKPENEGPFYIAEFQPSGWVTLGGMKTDSDCREVDSANKTIPDCLPPMPMPICEVPPISRVGSAQGFCVASGFIAGEAAADFAQA